MARRSAADRLETIEEHLRGLSEQGDSEQLLKVALSVIGKLSTRLDALLRDRYSPKSEKLDPAQLQLALVELARELDAAERDAAAETATETPDEPAVRPKPQRDSHPGRRALPAELPREEIRLRPEQTDCTECGKELHTIREERTEMLEWVPGHFKVIVEIREVTACSCGQSVPVTACAGPRVIEAGLPGPGLVAHLVISKYRDHSPVERQAKIYKRHGVDISPKTMIGWIEAAAWLLGPLARAIHERVLKAHVLQADDTHILVLQPGDEKGKGTSRGRIWAFVGDTRLVSYAYAPNWKGEHPAKLLKGRTGWLQGDGYAGYKALYALEGGPVEVGCWMHGRRYFKQALDFGDRRAAEALEVIAEMYQVERVSKDLGEDSEQRRARRERDTRPLLEKLGKWLADTSKSAPPRSSLGKALFYVGHRWTALTRFLEDGALEIDNGAVERAIRGIAIGRRNWLFAGSDAGAERAATLYTVIESAVLHGHEPWAYLSDVLIKLAAGWPLRRLGELLPDRWTPGPATASP
ncbi:MAG: IS66 family transposase [Nannocystis sp.]|nr:IS66 family transposase [Nannocystis sp.]MBA3546091.1 IS66 family transposase [Nannocystis sp.]